MLVAHQIDDQGEGRRRDHHRHDGQAVETVGEIDRIGRAVMTKPPTRIKNRPSGNSAVLRKGMASAPDKAGVSETHDQPGGQEGNGEFDHEAGAAR